jgi:predicted Zn-dependent protease
MRIKSAVRQIFRWGLTAIAALLVILHGNIGAGNSSFVIAVETIAAQHHKLFLPPSKPHPLPATLSQWHDQTNSGDYFQEVNPTKIGYLIWSQFPIKVYIQQPHPESSDAVILQSWASEVLQAIQEWGVYLPSQIVEQPDVADIKILRSSPPLRIAPNEKFPRARSAETSYELYVSSNRVLSHRCSILLSPNQTGKYLQAAARHEFGHALGIWGHSPDSNDALYFSQVRNPPPISARDVNTLKRVYQQPTRLGWLLPGDKFESR